MEDGRLSGLSPHDASPQLLWLPNGEVSSLPGDGVLPQISSWPATFQSSADVACRSLKTSVCVLHWQVHD